MTSLPPSRRPVSNVLNLIGWLGAVLAVFACGRFVDAYAAFLLLPAVVGFGALRFLRHQRRLSAPSRWPALLIGNLLILALLVSLLFLGFETYYRFIFDESDAMADTLVADAWYRRHYHRNNSGLRDNIDYPNARIAGKRRVTFVGDSFTAGLGLKNVEDRFVNRLRRLHPEWEVHAVAQPGLETSNEVEAMHNLTVSNHYQLDLVVLVYNINDIGEVMPGWIEEYKKMLADGFRKSWLCQNSYFVNLFYLRWQLRRNAYLQNYFEEIKAAYNGPLFEKHKIALTAFCNMTVIRGGRLLVVMFPFLHAPLQFQPAHERMNGFWAEKGVPHLDLLSIFSNLPPATITVNANDAHPNAYAHGLAAEAIDSFLKRQMVTNRFEF